MLVILLFYVQSEAEVKVQKEQLAKKVTTGTSSPTNPTVARGQEEATDSIQENLSTAEHSSQPVACPDGLRQRSTLPTSSSQPNSSDDVAVSSNTNNFSSMVSPATRQSTISTADALTPVPSRGWGSLLLMWVLLVAIVLLVARRIYITYYGPGATQSM